MKPRTLLQGLAGLAAWGCLSGLALVRLWAVLYGRVPGPAILAAAAALAAGCAAALATAGACLTVYALVVARSAGRR